MLQRHSLKDVAPAPHKVPGFLLHGISSQCAECRLLSSSLRFQRVPTFPLHTSLPNTREIFVTARSNAATSGSISVQMAVIVSLHKITKERGCQAGSGVAGGCAGGAGSHKAVRAKRISTGYGNNPHIGRERKTWMQPSICKPKWRIWQGAS